MYDLFQTVLLLSLLGGGLTALLLCLKPITTKGFPAQWQTLVWVVALLSMVLPVYQLVPLPATQAEPPAVQAQTEIQQAPALQTTPTESGQEAAPLLPPEEPTDPHAQLLRLEPYLYLWLMGAATFLLLVLGSYVRCLFRLRNQAVFLPAHPLLEEVKQALHITRTIRLGLAPAVSSPMLVGVFFPIVYLPCQALPKEHLRMVFLHELTHYKRKDLLLKWLALLVNAVHWFNPLAYLLRANLSEACEAACDRAVTRAMSHQERKQYMSTILTLAEA